MFPSIFYLFVTNSKTAEVERLQDTNETLAEELKDLHNAHQKEVREVQVRL